MYCSKCGFEINDNSQFCPKCGAQLKGVSASSSVGNMNEGKRHNKKTNIVLFFILGFVLASAIYGALMFISRSNRNSSNGKINKGFSTKEQAVYTYLDYFKKHDIDGMISCFAVEKFCENASFKNYIEHIGSYTPMTSSIIPVFGDYSNKIFIKRRVDSIIDVIYYQYLFLFGTDVNNGRLVKMSDYGSYNDMLNKQYPLENIDDLISGLKYENDYLCIDNLNFNGKLDTIIANNKSIYDYDDYDIIYIKFSFNDEKYVLCADVVKYDNKWYILGFTNTASSIINCSVICGGMTQEEYFSESISKYK